MTTQPPNIADIERSVEGRVIFHNVTWKDYELMLLIRGEKAVPRLTYLDGQLEIISPSAFHEFIKTNIARLLEVWSMRSRVRLSGYGSWTIKNERVERGLEPDECYVIGRPESGDRPDLAIEVTWTHGGLDKLKVYRKLGVPEVWRWEDGRIQVYALVDQNYEELDESAVLPTLDVRLIERFCKMDDQYEMIMAFEETLQRDLSAQPSASAGGDSSQDGDSQDSDPSGSGAA